MSDLLEANVALEAGFVDTRPLVGPDLGFGSTASLPFDGGSGRVVDSDGRLWDFRVTGASLELVAGMTRWLAENLSRSEKSASRRRTNKNKYWHLRSFLEFAARQPAGQQNFNAGLLEAYQREQFRTAAPATAYSRYADVRSAVIFLVNRNAIPRIVVPRNRSRSQVNAAAVTSGRTMATVFTTDAGYADAKVANEDLLAKLRDLLWDEVEALQAAPYLIASRSASSAFMACAYGLLAAACVNPTSISELHTHDLRPDDKDAALRRIVFDKGRAGGDVDLPPFPIGGKHARTIPRLWERLVLATEGMRDKAQPELKSLLMLREVAKTKKIGWYDDVAAGNILLPTLRRLITGKLLNAPKAGHTFQGSQRFITSATAEQERYAVIRTNAGRITYALIRNTAINVANARLRRNTAATQEAIGHKVGSDVLANAYLNNAQYREDLDHEVRDGQTFLENWIRRTPDMLPPDPKAVASAIGVDDGTAERLVADEFNLGMGASLVNGHTVVIDTPLNALRMMQWVDKLKAAEEGMVRDNPDRWEAVYEPQLVVFEHALQDFSYLSRQEAHRLWKVEEIELPFAEVI